MVFSRRGDLAVDHGPGVFGHVSPLVDVCLTLVDMVSSQIFEGGFLSDADWLLHDGASPLVDVCSGWVDVVFSRAHVGDSECGEDPILVDVVSPPVDVGLL